MKTSHDTVLAPVYQVSPCPPPGAYCLPGWAQVLPAQLLPQPAEDMLWGGQLQAVDGHQLCTRLQGLRPQPPQHLHHQGGLTGARHTTDVQRAAVYTAAINTSTGPVKLLEDVFAFRM